MAESLSNTDPLIWSLDQLLLLCFYGALDWGSLWQHLILAKAEQAEGLTFPRRERRSGNSPVVVGSQISHHNAVSTVHLPLFSWCGPLFSVQFLCLCTSLLCGPLPPRDILSPAYSMPKHTAQEWCWPKLKEGLPFVNFC